MVRETSLHMLWVKVFLKHLHAADRNIEFFILVDDILSLFEASLLYDWRLIKSRDRLVEIKLLAEERVIIGVLSEHVHYLTSLIEGLAEKGVWIAIVHIRLFSILEYLLLYLLLIYWWIYADPPFKALVTILLYIKSSELNRWIP